MTLQSDFEKSCLAYINAFEIKQGIKFIGYVNDAIGILCEFEDNYFLNLHEVIVDLEQNAPKGLILHWHNLLTECENSVNENYKLYLLEFSN